MVLRKFPILILANYRTGSSSFNHILSHNNNLDKFNEPHYEPDQMTILADKVENNENNFSVKFMPDQINDYQIYQTIYSSDCYKIKLQRRDKIAQIASYYIACVSGIWHSENPMIRGEKCLIPIYQDDINYSINKILDNDKMLDEMNVNFDQELYYEDLNLENSNAVKLNFPGNYNGICLYIKNQLKKQKIWLTQGPNGVIL